MPPGPPIGATSPPSRMASRMRCAMNHAVRYVTSSVRCSWCALKPFFEDVSRWKAASHLCSGAWLRSITVPVSAV